eukprot:scaffold870_cov268-Pinguiococcus_pyrenoidosus.AAC.43
MSAADLHQEGRGRGSTAPRFHLSTVPGEEEEETDGFGVRAGTGRWPVWPPPARSWCRMSNTRLCHLDPICNGDQKRAKKLVTGLGVSDATTLTKP